MKQSGKLRRRCLCGRDLYRIIRYDYPTVNARQFFHECTFGHLWEAAPDRVPLNDSAKLLVPPRFVR